MILLSGSHSFSEGNHEASHRAVVICWVGIPTVTCTENAIFVDQRDK